MYTCRYYDSSSKKLELNVPSYPAIRFKTAGHSCVRSLHCALASCGAVYCNRSCLCVCVFATGGRAGGLAGGVRTLLQPARAQCLRLSEHFFHLNTCFIAQRTINKTNNATTNSYEVGPLFVTSNVRSRLGLYA